jgi:SPP1 gp7 family putative phage head morphogenesis protein
MHKRNGHKPLVKAADVTAAMDDGATVEKLMRTFYPLVIESAFLDASLAGVPVAFNLEMEEVQQTLDRLAKRVRNVAESTKDEVRRLIGQQAENGWTTAELARHIREMGKVNSASRATMIARTELAAGYSQGSLAAYRASGVVDRKEWLLGPEPCAVCQPLGGAIVGLDDDFADGIDAPPAHPNCTCAVSPIVSPIVSEE